MTNGSSLLALTLLLMGCTVPELTIHEQTSSATQGDARAQDEAGPDAEGSQPSQRDAGSKSSVGTGKAAVAPAANGGSGGKAASASGKGGAPAAGSGGALAPARAGAGAVAAAAGSGDNAGAPAGSGPTSACAVWTKVSVRANSPPPGAVEGGFENVAGATNRQYVCRFQPAGSTFAIPGKYIAGLGCYVTYRPNGQQVDDASMLDGMIEVLTPAPGCSFSWRSATAAVLPAGVIDLGDPAGGRNYACHGDYSTVASSGRQVGTVITTTDNPPGYQCFFESFSNAIQPTDPQVFDVLVQD